MKKIVFLLAVLFCLFACHRAHSEDESPKDSYWPRVLRVYFQSDTTVKEAKDTFVPYGVGDYEGDPTPKKLLSEDVSELEIIEIAGTPMVRYIELAVPAGQEDAWMNVFKSAPKVEKVQRLSYVNRAATPSDYVPSDAYPTVALSASIPLTGFAHTQISTIATEVGEYLKSNLLKGNEVLRNYRVQNSERRRVLVVTNGRNIFMPKFWQSVTYDITIQEGQAAPSLLLLLQAKVAPGIPPTTPPIGNYRELQQDESAALGQYQLKVENEIMQHLEAWHPSTP